MITTLLLAGGPALLACFLQMAWCVKGIKAKKRKCLQREYEVEQATIANRCTDENAALFEGNLLKGLYGHFPPAPEFRPIDIRPPKPKSMLTCPTHHVSHNDDIQCPHCHVEDMKRRLCLSCGKAVPASGSKLCTGCDVPSDQVTTLEWQQRRMEEIRKADERILLATYSVPDRAIGSATDAEVFSRIQPIDEALPVEIAIPVVWDEKTQSVLPDVPKVVHDFGGNSNQVHV